MTEICIRQFYQFKRILSVKHDPRVCHLMKLNRKYVCRIRQFFGREVDWQRMTQSLPLAHRCLGEAQILRRDSLQGYEQIVVGTQFDVIARSRRAVEHDGDEIVAMRGLQISQETVY